VSSFGVLSSGAGVLAYNIVRLLMTQGTVEHGVSPWQIGRGAGQNSRYASTVTYPTVN
jgi:hypothetical protein